MPDPKLCEFCGEPEEPEIETYKEFRNLKTELPMWLCIACEERTEIIDDDEDEDDE